MTKDEAKELNEKAVAVAKLLGAVSDALESTHQITNSQMALTRASQADIIMQKLLCVAATYADLYEADAETYDPENLP